MIQILLPSGHAARDAATFGACVKAAIRSTAPTAAPIKRWKWTNAAAALSAAPAGVFAACLHKPSNDG